MHFLLSSNPSRLNFIHPSDFSPPTHLLPSASTSHFIFASSCWQHFQFVRLLILLLSYLVGAGAIFSFTKITCCVVSISFNSIQSYRLPRLVLSNFQFSHLAVQDLSCVVPKQYHTESDLVIHSRRAQIPTLSTTYFQSLQDGHSNPPDS